jgi:purine-binding chemotaxis protein CheW
MSGSNHSSFVLFELAGNTFGVRSQAVQSVEMVDHITVIPNSVPFLEGLTFTRGKVVPTINLRIRFGLPRIPVDLRARMLVVRSRDRTAGMLVDSAREFLSITSAVMRPAEEAIAGVGARYLEGIATLANRSVLILNVEEIIEGV